MAKIKEKDLKEDLLNQLETNGCLNSYFADLVDDYMNLWKTKNHLQVDIKKRGVQVSYNNGGGQSGVKKNDSVEQQLKVNMQMLKILAYLDLKPTRVEGEATDEDM